MKLSDATIRTAKPKSKNYKISDGHGLYIQIMPNGSKLWRVAYRFQRKAKTLYLGAYPVISLAKARYMLMDAKKLLAEGIDPSHAKKEIAKKVKDPSEQQQFMFRTVAQDWLKDYSRQILPIQVSKIERLLEKYLYPAYGETLVTELKAVHILEAARAKEMEGKHHTAHRLITLAGQVLDHAILLGYIKTNLARSGLSKKLTPEKAKHHAAIISPKEIGDLLCNIDDYTGTSVVKFYLQIIPYVFTRNSELRKAKWEEFDLRDKKLWVIPRERMKNKEEDHKVPLSDQVASLLNELKKITGNCQFLFPNLRSRTAPMSDVAPLNALRTMGYDKETMTVHGFRTTASTYLNELGYPMDHIERQLAHKERNTVRGAYNRAGYLEQRRQLLQDWANILDQLRSETRERRKALSEKRH